MKFFEHFPVMFYNQHQCKNIMARVKISDESRKNINLYYPYTIKDGDGRHDVIADKYYKDPFSSWLLYLANDVIDPYYDLGLTQSDFDAFIKKKYGTIETAKQKIAYYKTNWEILEDSSITTAAFNALEPEEKYYWEPITDVRGNAVRYERKKEDVIMNTNRVFEISVSDYDETFIEGEKVSTDSSHYGFVVSSNSTVVIVNNITGINTSNISTETLTGYESNTSCTVDSVVLLSENISANVEAIYWSSVSLYDKEEELNASKKNIEIIDSRYKTNIENELKRVLR